MESRSEERRTTIRTAWAKQRRVAGIAVASAIVGALVRGFLPPFVVDTEFLRDFLLSPPMAALIAIVGALIAAYSALRASKDANHAARRTAWWERARWAMDLALSTEPGKQGVARKALPALLGPENSQAEANMVDAALEYAESHFSEAPTPANRKPTDTEPAGDVLAELSAAGIDVQGLGTDDEPESGTSRYTIVGDDSLLALLRLARRPPCPDSDGGAARAQSEIAGHDPTSVDDFDLAYQSFFNEPPPTTKRAFLKGLCELLDIAPELELGVGSSIPAKAFEEAAKRVEVSTKGPMPVVAKRIVERAGMSWEPADWSSGSTVTAQGLKKVLIAVAQLIKTETE
ncbi:hypothetical protein [Demequina sp. NBRC 110054]|uniref:hypothetical protein n=1 Tax=Demequina sp. NBRC 110054 TaxID=1570343 RepID=UPI00117820A2|nr:hypothetical protein [Demequina sp. NBRC 110054]